MDSVDTKCVELLDGLLSNDYHSNDPGAAVLIVSDDRIIYQRCFGLANLVTGERVTLETNFRLASLTKQFTAYGIIRLEQEGKLSRTQTLGDFFSEKFRKKCPFVSNKVTIQHLLDHSSGLMDYEENDSVGHDQWSDEDVLETVTDSTLFEPGSQYRYSNTGYILLGLIIEVTSAMPLENFFRQRIFQPMHMKSSVLYGSNPTSIENRALGYTKGSDDKPYELSDQSPTSATRGDGGLYVSLKDYLQWYRHSSSLVEMVPFTIGESTYHYHLGWFLSDSSGQIRLHSGDSCGFTHQVFRIDSEQRKILVLYLTNLGNNLAKIHKFNRFIVENIPHLNPNNTDLLWDMTSFTR